MQDLPEAIRTFERFGIEWDNAGYQIQCPQNRCARIAALVCELIPEQVVIDVFRVDKVVYEELFAETVSLFPQCDFSDIGWHELVTIISNEKSYTSNKENMARLREGFARMPEISSVKSRCGKLFAIREVIAEIFNWSSSASSCPAMRDTTIRNIFELAKINQKDSSQDIAQKLTHKVNKNRRNRARIVARFHGPALYGTSDHMLSGPYGHCGPSYRMF
jgi:hypothetical protein